MEAAASDTAGGPERHVLWWMPHAAGDGIAPGTKAPRLHQPGAEATIRQQLGRGRRERQQIKRVDCGGTKLVEAGGVSPAPERRTAGGGVVAWMIRKFIKVVSYARSTSWTQNGIDHFELGDFSELLRALIIRTSPTPKASC